MINRRATIFRRAARFAAVLLLALYPTALAAQVPEPIEGELVNVALLDGSAITIDGSLNDWADVTTNRTTTGPAPATSAATGDFQWQIAADESTLYFAATITDEVIVPGTDLERLWNADSIELYLDMSGEEPVNTYGPGSAQIRISARDIGNTDPSALTLTGLGFEQFTTSGFVFETPVGWGFEIAVNFGELIEPENGLDFGFQVQANGTNGGDRDLKLSWSNADTNDTSFEDPSVFGRAAFADQRLEFDEPESDSEPVEDQAAVPDSAQGGVIIEEVPEPPASESASDAELARPEEPASATRSLLIATVISAVSVLVGGLLFERKRKSSEKQLAIAAVSESSLKEDELDEVDGEDIDALIASILESDTDGTP